MQPNEHNPHPIDYLDSISSASGSSSKKTSDKVFFGVIIGGIIIAIVVGILALMGAGSTNPDNMEKLGIRLKALQTVVDSSRKTTVSSSLRATNTSLSLVLTSANRDIDEQLTGLGLDPKKLNPKITAEESTEELTRRLESARLNGLFDRTYAREMSYQLETLLVLIRQVESNTNNEKTKDVLNTTYNNIEPLREQFSSFDDTTK